MQRPAQQLEARVAVSTVDEAGARANLDAIGPLRFEWAFPLDRRRDPITGAFIDAPVDFQFTIGSFF